MSVRKFKIMAVAVSLLGVYAIAGAQAYTSSTPYSFFGIGDIPMPGTAFNRSMGGVGIATRNNRFLNVVNPAAVTARDSLAFMADMSLYGDNKFFRQRDAKSVGNTFNINDLVLSFPIYRHSAAMLGIMPYSGTGYGYSYAYEDPSLIGKTGNISYSATGIGSTYQAFVAAGVSFFNRLSAGAQFNYLFGDIKKSYYETFSDSSYNGVSNGSELQLKGMSGKFGLQYEQPVGNKSSVVLGVTYSMGIPLHGYSESYRYSSGTAAVDTLSYRSDTLSRGGNNVGIPSEIGIGVCFRYADKFMAELDYTRSDWTDSGMDINEGFAGNRTTSSISSSFRTSVSEAFRIGFEYVPNRNDIRYYLKKVSYRAGAYFKKDYFILDGHNVNSMGLTLGATLPIFRWYNGLTVALDLGQRGTLKDNMIRERYINFSVGVNIFDIWFQKPMYD